MRINEKFAELLGAFIGDGWIESRESGMYILGNKTEDKDYHDFVTKNLFKKVFGIDAKVKLFKQWHAYGVVTYNKRVIRTALKNGFSKGKKNNTVRIPDKLLNKSKNFLISIVRGVFDTDGSFYCKKGYGIYDNEFRRKFHCAPKLEISSNSIELLKQLNVILKRVNIDSIVRVSSREGLINGRQCKQCYRLTIYRINDIHKFFNVIKPNNQRHITRYKVWKKIGFLPPNTTITERKKILKKEVTPSIYYAGVPERSNGQDFLTKCQEDAKLKN